MSGVFRVLSFAAAFLLSGAFAAFAESPKFALVITNKDYPPSIGALENTHRDGERVAAALKALGFSVVHRRDLDKTAMVQAVADYVERLEKAGPEAVGFFYYAGHGAANSKYGENYLIPVAAPIVSDTQLSLQAVKIGEIIDTIAATSAKANFLVFDACRNVPMSFSVRSATRGLRPEAHRQGLLIAFATDPGKTATDEGIYAQALTEEIQKPGVLATEVFRTVRSRVLAATEHRQFPWIEDGLIENMYFKPPLAESGQAVQTAALAPPKLSLPADQPAPVMDCDLYAASPYDPERRATGVALDKIDTAKAIPACNAASDAYPQERRFRYQLARTLIKSKSFAKAEEIFRELANGGYAAALAALGEMYKYGEGVAQDTAEAVRLFRKAAEVGFTYANIALGAMYYNGEGVAQDKAEAARLYRKAADLGDAEAMYYLGSMYEDGEGGIPQDKGEAARLYQKAADLGNLRNPDVIYWLGLEYRLGWYALPSDKAKAARLFRKAADLGNTDAMYWLADMYENGEGGLSKDYAEAARLYQKNVDLNPNDPSAMHKLAELYEKGRGVKQDSSRAAELFVMVIKKHKDLYLASISEWSEAFRKELQQLLKNEGVYKGRIDGKASEALENAVQTLAAKSKSGG